MAASARMYKEFVDSLSEPEETHAVEMPGKEPHQERVVRGKRAAAHRRQPRYMDACRVVKGMAPKHGFFKTEEPKPTLSPEVATRLAAEADGALAELAQPAEVEAVPAEPEDLGAVVVLWSERLAKLEAKITEPLDVPPKGATDIDELGAIAQEVVDFKQRFKEYRNCDLKTDADLRAIEDRLDVVAEAFLPTEEEQPNASGVDELRESQRRLTTQLVRHSHWTAGLSPSEAREVEQLVFEVAELKAKLRVEGLTEREQDKDSEVLKRLIRLAELRQKGNRDKKRERGERAEVGRFFTELDYMHAEIEGYKQRLRDERGLTRKDVRHDLEVCELEEHYKMLMRLGGA